MARTKSLASKRHRKIRKAAKGYRDSRGKRVKVAKETLLHARKYQYVSRKLIKRDLRKLWITRLTAASRENGTSYSKFIAGLKSAKIDLDRKVLSDIAIHDPETFTKIAELAKKSFKTS